MTTALQRLGTYLDAVGSGYRNLFRSVLSIKPKSNELSIPINLSWKAYGENCSYQHVALAILGLAILFGVVKLGNKVEVLKYSPLTLVVALFNLALPPSSQIDNTQAFLVFVLLATLLTVFGKGPLVIPAIDARVYKILPYLALKEELMFRYGAEAWSWWGRLRSAICFGLMHLALPILPFSIAIALGVLGFYFTISYLWLERKTRNPLLAVRDVAIVHTTYNIIVFGLFLLLTTRPLSAMVAQLAKFLSE